MSRKSKLAPAALAAVSLFIIAGEAWAQGQTAYQRGIRIGVSRGYAPGQLECYAQVFARRATIGPGGGWVAAVDASFTDELWKRCRISR